MTYEQAMVRWNKKTEYEKRKALVLYRFNRRIRRKSHPRYKPEPKIEWVIKRIVENEISDKSSLAARKGWETRYKKRSYPYRDIPLDGELEKREKDAWDLAMYRNSMIAKYNIKIWDMTDDEKRLLKYID